MIEEEVTPDEQEEAARKEEARRLYVAELAEQARERPAEMALRIVELEEHAAKLQKKANCFDELTNRLDDLRRLRREVEAMHDYLKFQSTELATAVICDLKHMEPRSMWKMIKL